MINNKNKTTAIVLGIFALVIVTTVASFAFFTYSRVGNTTTTITSGDIEFTYKEGEDASLANAFPVSDSVGANDTSEEYTFTVNLKSTSASNKMNYNVYLLDANDDANTNYFNNEQIKFALIKDGTFVADTSGNAGRKLTDIDGFDTGATTGEGLVLENQEIVSGKTDEYKLRIWISDDVNYSNTDRVDDNTDEFNDAQTSTGKYNGYKYSLKIKVTSGVITNIPLSINNLNINNLTVTADLENSDGLSAYAVTQNETAPEIDSSEWVDLTKESENNVTSKGNVVKTSISKITKKSIEYMVKKNGTYYLHLKNMNGEVVSKTFIANATGENAVDKIVNLASINTNELRIDEHAKTGQQNFASKEYRYWGATPNNYVWFNNELWRIIGAIDVDNGSGIVEKRLKIIRKDSIGNYSWDSSASNINDGGGVNEWNQADLMKLLNSGAYYNRTSGSCYNAKKNGKTSCDFSENSTTPGLTTEAKEMIENAKWYLGASSFHSTQTSEEMYKLERASASGKQCTQSDSTYSGCSDTVTRIPYWIGQLGLMYPSDYGYTSDMSKCSSIKLDNYYTSCYTYTWLFNEVSQWTISPIYGPNHAYFVAYISTNGRMSANSGFPPTGILPVTYLKSNIKILDGDGSTSKPFVLSK